MRMPRLGACAADSKFCESARAGGGPGRARTRIVLVVATYGSI